MPNVKSDIWRTSQRAELDSGGNAIKFLIAYRSAGPTKDTFILDTLFHIVFARIR